VPPWPATRVRRASATDAGALASLRWSWRVDERGESGMARAEFVSAFSHWLVEHQGSHVPFVADIDGVAVGMAWLATIERVPGPDVWRRVAGHLQSVYVLPAHRGAGLGAALIGASLREAADRQCDYVSVHPSERAFPLYRRLGFREHGGVLEADLRQGAAPDADARRPSG